jgi:hypothetical protein
VKKDKIIARVQTLSLLSLAKITIGYNVVKIGGFSCFDYTSSAFISKTLDKLHYFYKKALKAFLHYGMGAQI